MGEAENCRYILVARFQLVLCLYIAILKRTIAKCPPRLIEKQPQQPTFLFFRQISFFYITNKKRPNVIANCFVF